MAFKKSDPCEECGSRSYYDHAAECSIGKQKQIELEIKLSDYLPSMADLLGGGVRSAKLKEMGDSVRGKVVFSRVEQEQDFVSKQLKFFVGTKNPKHDPETEEGKKEKPFTWQMLTQDKITPEHKAAAEGEDATVRIVPLPQIQVHLQTDTGTQRIFLNGDRLRATKEAFKAAGRSEFENGGEFGIKVAAVLPPNKRIHEALYVPPQAG